MIGIKLADGTFYPILEDAKSAKKRLALTTAENGQTTVQVDLYKSNTNSMTDATYVDSLLIENLIPHDKNEPEIPLVIGLDENNILSAEISDVESGKTSNMSVSLVTLSDDKRKTVPDYNVLDPVDNTELPTFDTLETPTDTFDQLDTPAEPVTQSDPVSDFDFSMPDFDFPTEELPEPTETVEKLETPVEPFDKLETPVESFETLETPTDTFDTLDTPIEPVDSFDQLDTPVEAVEQTDASLIDTKTTPTFEDEVSSLTDETTDDDDFDFSDTGAMELGSDIEEPPEIVKQQIANSFEPTQETEIDQTELPDVSSSFNTDDLSFLEPEEFTEPEIDVNTDTSISPEPEIATKQETVFPDNNDDSFSLPDFDSPVEPETIKNTEPEVSTEQEFVLPDSNDDSFSLPDLNFSEEPESTTEPYQSENTAEPEQIPEQKNYSQSENYNDMNFDFPSDEENIATSPKPTNNSKQNIEPSLGFQDLYDEETLQGMDQHNSKKSIVPMIICIICAVVSVIALLGIIFFVPSHIDITVKQHEPEPIVTEIENTSELLSEPIPEPQETFVPEEVIPAAPVENAIIIAETPEIIPIVPKEVPKKQQDVTYKIKWGDTLWDLAATYYKNPWKYHKIAKANGIKDPDYIISGTYITIPSE